MDWKLEVCGLAMIVGASPMTENIGKVITLLHRIPAGKIGFDPSGTEYTIEDCACWIVEGEALATGWSDGRKIVGRYTRCAEYNLMPLSGDPDAQVVADEQALEV